MGLSFEWDSREALWNVAKHGVSFHGAFTVFADRLSVTKYDPDHSRADEDRFITLGVSARGRLLVVVHCHRGESIRVISARQATRRERMQYEEPPE